MVNLNTVLNERISRIARKEIKAQTGATKKATIRYRSDIAALKRQIQDLTRRLAGIQSQLGNKTPELPSELPEGVRYSTRTVKAQRARLNLSARDFGKLIGVTEMAVYGWESGKSRPRNAALAKLVAIRGIGKREAARLLAGPADGKSTPAAERSRGPSRQTAEEFITWLVKGGNATTSAEINWAWKKSARPGKADNTLSRMVGARKLARTKLDGQRGSRYSIR